DDEARPHLRPWLAALLVAPTHRRQGIGSALVRELQRHTRRLGEPVMYLGTDQPAFYERLGALRHERTSPTMWVMKLVA
ncbi:MAG: GNAT family N-acetyltransferase, partial [Phycisphaeraceae bacterium]